MASRRRLREFRTPLSTLANVSMTPFGSPVEPDVYCKKATESSSSGASLSPFCTFRSRSVAFQTKPAGHLWVSDRALRMESNAFSVKHSDAPQDFFTRSNFFSPIWSFDGSGGYVGTATHRNRRQLQKASTNAKPGK